MIATLLLMPALAGQSVTLQENIQPEPHLVSQTACVNCDAFHGDPIALPGSHIHTKGDGMIAYRYTNMQMDRMYQNDSSRNTASARTKGPDMGYMMVPTEMTMQMHMLSAMYAPSDDVTFMAMIGYAIKDMKMQPMMGPESHQHVEGYTDTKIGVLYGFDYTGNHRLHSGVTLSLPTGSTNKKNADGLHLGYGMQLGSGTYDVTSSLTYRYEGIDSRWHSGAQIAATLRIDENKYDYTLGNVYSTNAWVAYSWTSKLSTSIRTEYMFVEEIRGQDPNMPAAGMAPGVDATLSGKQSIDFYLGASYEFSDYRVSGELELPVWRYTKGLSMMPTWRLTLGLTYYF